MPARLYGVKRIPSGFTLIEMLTVVAILVVLAGLILPKLDREQLRANKGVAANNMASAASYIRLYYVRHNIYPDRWDSLLTGSGSLWTPGAPGSGVQGLDPQLTGGPPTGSPNKLTTTTLTEDSATHEVRSLARMGITTFLSQGSASVPGDAFNVAATLADGSKVATINVSDADGMAIIDSIYPENKLSTGTSGSIPAGNKLVVVGFGPINTAIGDVLQECPTYANTDHTQYYDRFLAIFETHADGSRAELKKVVGGDGDLLSDEVGDYYQK
ncbi:MAG TPA: prepilin-type N-terminal cleavage/methylation domain-containing protein [Planctomycetota bacterium]|nr:prepilin-type N-terminal cleavage/methylation domain-containing protein [Planctomycetota bacterium]